MAKQKEKSEVEFLRAENKSLKKEIKLLKRKLDRKDKRAHQYEDLEEKQQEILNELEQLEKNEKEPITIKQKDSCPKCGSATDGVEIGIRTLRSCLSCDWRITEKTKKEEAF